MCDLIIGGFFLAIVPVAIFVAGFLLGRYSNKNKEL